MNIRVKSIQLSRIFALVLVWLSIIEVVNSEIGGLKSNVKVTVSPVISLISNSASQSTTSTLSSISPPTLSPTSSPTSSPASSPASSPSPPTTASTTNSYKSSSISVPPHTPPTASSPLSPSSPSTPYEELDQFLSFEEWRKLNLEKSGQSEKDLIPRQYEYHVPKKSHIDSDFVDDELEIEMNMFQPSDPESDSDHDGKLYKQRFNYASFDCAATVMKSNTNAKGVGNVLSENKDTYLLNKCSEPSQFFIIELCQDILVDEVSVANYEFFSSMFKRIRISVSDRFPVPSSGWKVLGEFEAKSVRDIQSFKIDNPLIWARYLRIEVLSHWGHEYYCPISLVRVHGTTMMDEYRNQEGVIEKEEKDRNRQREGKKGGSKKEEVVEKVKVSGGSFTSDLPEISLDGSWSSSIHSKPLSEYIASSLPLIPSHTVISQQPSASLALSKSKYPLSSSSSSLSTQQRHSSISYSSASYSPSSSSYSSSLPPLCDSPSSKYQFPPLFPGQLISPLVLNESCQWDEYINNQSIPIKNKTSHSLPSLNTTIPTPKTQDSIYQTIMKRLSLLESNTTLSLQYVEMQSQNLRDLLLKIEKKQTSRIETFFQEFNQTVSEQIRSFQFQYSKLLLSTVDEMEAQRRRNDEDLLLLGSRLSLMTDELVYQKRLGIAQAIVLLVVLIFVITTRATPLDSALTMSLHGNKTGIGGLWHSVMSSPVVTSPKRRSHIRGVSNSSAEWYDEAIRGEYDFEQEDREVEEEGKVWRRRKREEIWDESQVVDEKDSGESDFSITNQKIDSKFPLPIFSNSLRKDNKLNKGREHEYGNESNINTPPFTPPSTIIIQPDSETDNDISS